MAPALPGSAPARSHPSPPPPAPPGARCTQPWLRTAILPFLVGNLATVSRGLCLGHQLLFSHWFLGRSFVPIVNCGAGEPRRIRPGSRCRLCVTGHVGLR